MSEEEREILQGLDDMKHLEINPEYKVKIINGILDLYSKEKLNSLNLSEQLNKEKEKNKKLEDKIKGMYDKSNKLIEVTNLYLNTSSKLERLENKIKMRIEQLESEFKEHEEKGLNGLIQKLDCGTRIEALKDLLKD